MKKNLLLFVVLFAATLGTTFGQFSNPKPLLEEYTGTWCQFCADGAYRVQQVLQNVPSANAIAIHVGDVMEVPDGGTIDGFYGPSYPQGMINRDGGLYSRNQWMSLMNTAAQGATSASVAFDSLDYNAATREITGVLKVTFTGPESGDFRFNVAVTESKVTGGAQYSQVNSDNNTPGHPYQGAGNPIVGFEHNHVLRAYTGGAWGEPGLIPATVNFGSTATYSFSYTIPTNFNENEIHVVGMVQEFGPTAADRRVLNSDEAALPGLVGVEGPLTAESDLMHLAPNPMSDLTRVTYTMRQGGFIRLEVLDITGKQVAVIGEGYENEGVHSMVWEGLNQDRIPVESGMYLIRLVTDYGQSLTQRVMVGH